MTSTPTPTPRNPSSTHVLARTAAHLEAAYAHACAAAGRDLLSPWASTAMSIHLAAAGLSRHLPEPAPAASQPDCLNALTAAQAEIMLLGSDHQVPVADLTLIRTRLATALSQAQSLTGAPPTAQP